MIDSFWPASETLANNCLGNGLLPTDPKPITWTELMSIDDHTSDYQYWWYWYPSNRLCCCWHPWMDEVMYAILHPTSGWTSQLNTADVHLNQTIRRISHFIIGCVMMATCRKLCLLNELNILLRGIASDNVSSCQYSVIKSMNRPNGLFLYSQRDCFFMGHP